MLERILEPEVMDTEEEALEYDAMDHAEVNATFVQDLLATGPLRGEVLDVGTGTGLIPLELCRVEPSARVLGVDLADSMLRHAREHARSAGLESRIRFEKVDAKGLPFADGAFMAVMSNSIVHHIPRPATAFAEMARVLAPGGRVFVRDLLRPADEATWQGLVETYAGEASPKQRQLFADSLHASLTVDEVRDLVVALGFPADGVQATSDRHWTWSATRA